MLTRRDTLRGGTASVAAIAVTGVVAAVAVPAMTDELLFEAIRAFHEAYEPTQRASAASHAQWEETMARAKEKGLRPGSQEFNDFFDENLSPELFEDSNAAWDRTGERANAVFAVPALTFQGAIEKLRIVRLAVGSNGDGSNADANLDAFQDYEEPWFDKVLADLERLAGEAAS